MLDLVNFKFKAINDGFGHALGHELLIGWARCWRSIAPDECPVLRYDGDELAILLLGFTLGEATGLAECLHVVREQVETEKQVRVLRDLGCDSAQGFYLGRPQPRSPYAPLGRPLGPRAASGRELGRSSESGSGGETTVTTPRTLMPAPSHSASSSATRNGRPKRTS